MSLPELRLSDNPPPPPPPRCSLHSSSHQRSHWPKSTLCDKCLPCHLVPRSSPSPWGVLVCFQPHAGRPNPNPGPPGCSVHFTHADLARKISSCHARHPPGGQQWGPESPATKDLACEMAHAIVSPSWWRRWDQLTTRSWRLEGGLSWYQQCREFWVVIVVIALIVHVLISCFHVYWIMLWLI
ncbi:hypothetical protein EDB81DRAFT_401410 [Dactylonectria macrodidyma]|uniref:Uncharacterized protein n=1 Tax=Dactylonectria macrodidyma TaxID=307937 RepID=A0A9P9JAG7_9HYPO|nr:hypothetical protein EDB81DRAFT_401410 [Dactylonectria macrodidyma]